MATFAQYYHQFHKHDRRKAGVGSEAKKCNVPLLSKHKVNRVMIYVGSFNPPHVGHLDVLCHAFQSSSDLNIVAGLVYPVSDSELRTKCFYSNRRLVLSKERRAELWERDVQFPTWAFAPREDFETEIASTAKKDRYDIHYIRVLGPDNWDINKPPRHISACYPEYLVTNAARRASFVTPNGVPQRMKGYTSWKKLGPDPKPKVQPLQQTRPVVEVLESSPSVATTMTAGSTPSSSAEDLGECPSTTEVVRREQEDTIWECFEKCHPGVRALFVCKKDREVGLLGDVTKEISSTALYRIITESRGEDRRRQLQNQVLSADDFCDFLEYSGFDKVRAQQES